MWFYKRCLCIFHTENAAVASPGPTQKAYTVATRLSNTEEKPLTKHNLQVLSMSIPELHQRVTGRPSPFAFHTAYLQWDTLPKEPLALQPSTPPKTSSPIQHAALAKALRCSLGKPAGPTPATPDKEDLPSSSSQEDGATAPDWLKCDGSFIPDISNKEWTMVSFQNEDFMRCISPVVYTDDAGDIAGRCNMTDYTEYGQLVLSVDIDFLQERSKKGDKELTGPAVVASGEKMKPPESPASGKKTARHKKRHSTPTRRSSGSSHSTPTRSPMRI